MCVLSEVLSVYFFSELPLFIVRLHLIVLLKWFPQMYIYCNTVHIYLMRELFSFIRSKQSHSPSLLLSLTLQVMSEPEKSGTQKTAPFQGDPMTYSCESWLLMIWQVSSSLSILVQS